MLERFTVSGKYQTPVLPAGCKCRASRPCFLLSSAMRLRTMSHNPTFQTRGSQFLEVPPCWGCVRYVVGAANKQASRQAETNHTILSPITSFITHADRQEEIRLANEIPTLLSRWEKAMLSHPLFGCSLTCLNYKRTRAWGASACLLGT